MRKRLNDPKGLLIAGGLLLLAIYLLRACVPGLRKGMPAELLDDLQTRYVVCLNDTPIWPGEPRQPTCGQVDARAVGEGTVPQGPAWAGVSRALCFRVTYTNPYWTTQGQTRHEILLRSRTASKVAALRDGAWSVSADEEITDRQPWIEFACPGAHDPSLGLPVE